MTVPELRAEKALLQRVLLQFEEIHGHPEAVDDRDVWRPLYDTYALVKRLLAMRGSPRNSGGSDFSFEDGCMKAFFGFLPSFLSFLKDNLCMSRGWRLGMATAATEIAEVSEYFGQGFLKDKTPVASTVNPLCPCLGVACLYFSVTDLQPIPEDKHLKVEMEMAACKPQGWPRSAHHPRSNSYSSESLLAAADVVSGCFFFGFERVFPVLWECGRVLETRTWAHTDPEKAIPGTGCILIVAVPYDLQLV